MTERRNETSSILRRLFGLDGHVASVVGGAGRIGRSLCHALAQAGAKICILDNDQAAAEALARELVAAGAEVLVQAVDATQPDQLEQAVAMIRERLGPPDILVNAAQ